MVRGTYVTRARGATAVMRAQRLQGGQFCGLDGSSRPSQFAVIISWALTASSVGASTWTGDDSELALEFNIVEGCLEYRGLVGGGMLQHHLCV